ncbi:MAG: WD40/YVTN/BNR-like repeat-containing protein, partial [Waddliaceae bacterium]
MKRPIYFLVLILLLLIFSGQSKPKEKKVQSLSSEATTSLEIRHPEKSFSKKTLGRLLQNLQSSDLLFDQKPTRLNSQSKQIISNQEKHWENTLNKTAPQELLVSEDQFVYRLVSALAISPNFADDQTIFAGIYNGGVFKSTDSGKTWKPVNSGLTTLRVTSLAISPGYATDHTVFVGIHPRTSLGGVLKSTDGGDTWNPSGPFTPGSVEDLALSPNFVDDQTVFAATDGMAVMKSTDGGNSWDQRIPGNSSQLWSVAMSPSYSTDSTVFAGALRGIYKSSNGGKSWIRTYDVFEVSCFGFSPTFAQDQTIFAGTLDGLLKSTDGGLSWAPALLESAAKILLSPDYANDQTLFVATAAGVFKSNDRGDTWEARNNGLTDFNVETLVLSPNYLNDHKMFAGTHEGVFKSSESDTEWKPINNGLLLTFGIENLTKSPYQLDTVPTIAVDSLGNVHVAWWGTYASSASPDGITTDAFYSRIVDETFERPLRIVVPTGYYSIDVSLAVDKDGYAHIAFRRGDFLRNDFKDDIYYATNKEGDFGSPIFVVEQESWGVDSPWDPFIAVDKDGGAHVAFDGLFKSQIFYTNNLAGFFTEPIVVPSPKFFLGGDPSLVIDNSGNAHIAYRGESETSIADIYYVNNVGGSFNNALNVSRREGGEDRPSLALDNL